MPKQWEVWICRDGREMTVTEMTDAHINYSIAMIMRSQNRPKWRHHWLPRLVGEIERRMKENGEQYF